jgi:hypothetical protein
MAARSAPGVAAQAWVAASADATRRRDGLRPRLDDVPNDVARVGGITNCGRLAGPGAAIDQRRGQPILAGLRHERGREFRQRGFVTEVEPGRISARPAKQIL